MINCIYGVKINIDNGILIEVEFWSVGFGGGWKAGESGEQLSRQKQTTNSIPFTTTSGPEFDRQAITLLHHPCFPLRGWWLTWVWLHCGKIRLLARTNSKYMLVISFWLKQLRVLGWVGLQQGERSWWVHGDVTWRRCYVKGGPEECLSLLVHKLWLANSTGCIPQHGRLPTRFTWICFASQGERCL